MKIINKNQDNPINENISANDIEIIINKRKLYFSFEEAEALYTKLTDYFINLENEEEYGWELKEGVPPVYDILENSINDYGYMNFQTKYEAYEVY